MEYDIKHLKLKHPFSAVVAGSSGTGKTILIRRILEDYRQLFHGLNSTPNVLWAYGQYHMLINEPISNVRVHYTDSIPTLSMINNIRPNVIVIDDLMSQVNKEIEDIFTKYSHHLNITVIFSVQNMYYNKIRTISLNSQYLFLMKSPRDKQQIYALARQLYPTNIKTLIQAYNDATKEAYGYLCIDFTPDCPEEIRMRTRITSAEVKHLGKKFSPIIYKIKNVA